MPYVIDAAEMVRSLWAEHKLAVRARGERLYQEIAAEMAAGPPNPVAVVDALRYAMWAPEVALADAVGEGWMHLSPRVGARGRGEMEAALADGPDQARWRLAQLAEQAGDSVIVASRLFDHPGAATCLWLRDGGGPALYVFGGEGRPSRVSPAGVGEILVRHHGEGVTATLRAVARAPLSAQQASDSCGASAPAILEDAARLLVLREVAGAYRPRGLAAQVVLQGLGA